MTVAFADGLAPEVYPLAWLVGRWRGEGTIGYGPVDPGAISQEIEFEAVDGPYLAYRASTWLLPGQADAAHGSAGEGESVDAARSSGSLQSTRGRGDADGAAGDDSSVGRRDTPGGPDAAAGDGNARGGDGIDGPTDPTDASPARGALWHQESGFWRVTPGQTQIDPPFEVEVLISDAAGYQSVYLGQVNGPRVDLGTDAMIRTASAPEINAATRMYGLVGGDLLWAWDIAGFGLGLGSYLAARLSRTQA
ncbi:MAG: FABP family protein [Bifidobacteriaceae bacterium]|nr:FABP family protein [Bifidobacteriaceae bacterium]